MYNWKINITTWERSMNFGDIILEMSGKRNDHAFLWWVLFIQFQSWRGLSELLEVMFLVLPALALVMSPLQNWHCLVYLDMLSCVDDFLHMIFK